MGNIQTPTPEQLTELKSNFELNCKLAASCIFSAHCFLFASGAGFSADSGLAVYKDIADVPAYREKKRTYYDICQPHWIKTDPELFYGFWGACFNDYRQTKPHLGYDIIKSWRDMLFSESELWTQTFREENESFIKIMSELSPDFPSTIFTKEDVAHLPGPFFVVTSNVDAHSQKSGLKKTEILQIHGSTEIWQCHVPCCKNIWTAPENFRFEVDRTTMLAPNPTIETDTEKLIANKGFASRYPHCINPQCSALARPAILMFGDSLCILDKIEHKLYSAWRQTALKLLEKKISQFGHLGNRLRK